MKFMKLLKGENMKKIYKFICIPLLHINSNVYTFFSGIAVSVATNIFTTICIDDFSFSSQWNLYVATLSFTILSGLLLFISTKISGFQEFANNPGNEFDNQMKDTIIYEATEENYKSWVKRYFLVVLSLVIGVVFFSTDFSWLTSDIIKLIMKKIGG